MSTSTETELEIASRVLDLARAAAGPSAQIDVAVDRIAQALTRFANSHIHQNVADITTSVQLRVHADGRTTSGATTITGADALRDLVERTIAATKLSPVDPGWPGLAPAAPVLTGGFVDEAIIAASPMDRADRVRAFIEAADGLTAAGYFRTLYRTSAFANSAGQAVSGRCTEAALDAIAKTATSDGVARQAARRIADIDGAVHGARAAAKARASADPIEIDPGQYEVVLEPTATADLLLCFAHAGFNGKAANEGTSFLKLGEQQLDASVTLVDDPVTETGSAGLAFDSEGTPRSRLVLVENGVTRTPAHDLRTAAEGSATSTGHAADATAMYSDGGSPANIRLEPTGGAPATEVDGPAADSVVLALVSQVERGLLVTDHWYTRCLDTRRLVMTGLTRNGVWLIEHGEITRPVGNLRFTQSYPEALAPGRVLGIGGHAVALPTNWGVESPMAPALRLASWNFTGGASG